MLTKAGPSKRCYQGMFMAGAGDFKAHERTYTGFLGLLKWGTIASAIVAAFVVYLLAS